MGFLVLALARTAVAPPPIPHETYGLATSAGGPALAVNSPIRALIDGVDYSNQTSVFAADGSYQVQIAGNWYIGATSETPWLKEGGDTGDPVMFSHGDFTTLGRGFRQTTGWTFAGFENLNLQEGVSAKQPALLKIQSITTRPQDLGTQYMRICNPTSGTVDLANYYLEKDRAGGFDGPTLILSGTVAPGSTIFVDLLSTAFLTNNGDALKLVYENPGGPDSPFASNDVIVDRVEYNATSGGTLTWEPGNTIMFDAPAPALNQEIRRNTGCADTNSGFDFTIAVESGRPTAPSVTVSAPNGGEKWSGGSLHTISWNMADNQDANNFLTVYINYSTDSGASWPNTVVSGRAGTANPNTYTWTIPGIDSTTVRVRVCATDRSNLTGCDASDTDFEIDNTNPGVIDTDPNSGQVGVPPNQDVTIVFSETMNRATVQNAFSISPDPGPAVKLWQWSQTSEADDTLFVPLNILTLGQTYTVTISTGARDGSDPGKNLIPAESFSFTVLTNTAPTVQITAPLGGCWSGGFPHTITWTMSDPETPAAQLVVYVNYTSPAGGGTIAGPLTGATSTSWTPVGINSNDVRITVTAIDALGTSRTETSNPIEVDSTAPSIMTTTPGDGGTGIALDAPVIIQFSEAMDMGAFASGFTMTPNPGGITFNWAANTVTINHARFAPGTMYTVTITGATDDCDPGTPLPTRTIAFTTRTNANPTAQVTAPAAGQVFAPGATITIGWTMNDAETPTNQLIVFLNYTSSAGNGQITTTPLTGQTSYVWTSPGISATDVRIQITVIDADGGAANAQSEAFTLGTSGPDLTVIGGLGILIAVIVVAALLFLLMKRRKKKEEPLARAEPAAPARAPPAPRAPPPARIAVSPAAPAAPAAATKECPSCGTIVDGKDTECFMCGTKF